MSLQLKRGAKLVIATHNPGKVWEFQKLFEPYGITLLAAGDLGVPEPEETGATFEENARLKAVICAAASGLPALADDSGVEIDALGGEPGIYSARWAGETKDFTVAMARVERELAAKGVDFASRPSAHFTCALCLAAPDLETQIFEARVPGHLAWPPRGFNGFGYDPIFVPEGHAVTFGEMEPALKYTMTHRARAFEKFKAAALDHHG